MMQLNWWLPVYDVTPDNVVAFHPHYFDQGIANGSERYNYYAWNRDSRAIAASQIGVDTRDQPKPEEPIDLDPQIRPVPPVGGVMVFSGAQLHSSVPNTSGRTRFSVDFRVVHRADVEAGRGAANVDSTAPARPCATTCASPTWSGCPPEVVAPYDAGVPDELLEYAIYTS